MARRAAHRRLWWVGLGLLVVGLALSFDAVVVAWVPGLLVLAVAAGLTASDPVAPPRRLALAWSVPVGTTLVTLGAVGCLFFANTDGLLLFLVALVLVPTALAVWAAFGVAAGVAAVLARRRRFGAPGEAWETGPTRRRTPESST